MMSEIMIKIKILSPYPTPEIKKALLHSTIGVLILSYTKRFCQVVSEEEMHEREPQGAEKPLNEHLVDDKKV